MVLEDISKSEYLFCCGSAIIELAFIGVRSCSLEVVESCLFIHVAGIGVEREG